MFVTKRSWIFGLLLTFIFCLPSHSATQKWIGGYYSATGTAAATWTAISSTEINSLTHGDFVLLSTQINNDPANSGNGDLYANFSFVFGAVSTQAGTPYLQLYLFPLNEDGSTYGDNSASGTGAAGPPAAQYATNCIVPVTASLSSTAFKGSCTNVPLPASKFKMVLYDNLNTTGSTASSGNTVYIQTYNFVIQ
jgi:hypothetical protein